VAEYAVESGFSTPYTAVPIQEVLVVRLITYTPTTPPPQPALFAHPYSVQELQIMRLAQNIVFHGSSHRSADGYCYRLQSDHTLPWNVVLSL